MLASASASYAQDAANPESGAVANPADEDNAIVVTGSRVARTGFENPTPTTVVSAEQIANSGLNDIGDILLQSPQISVGLGASNDTFERDIGATFVNLRGLGTNRTLVLVDGRRRVSGSRDGSQVDVSAIPASMIESVEIITGGASAVYGADAVSGVVNIILKDDMDGLTASGRYGLSSRGDADTYMLSLAGGGSFADGRGSARLGVTYNKSEMLKYTARDYVYEDRATWVANPANTGPDDGIADRIPASPFFSSNIAYDPSFVIGGQRYYYDDATLIPQYATNCYGTVCTDGDYGYTGRERNLRNPRESFAAIAGIEYEVSDAVTAFADFEFSFADTVTNGQSFFDSSLVLQRDNPFIPDEVAALMDANALSTLTIGYEGEEIFGNKGYTNSRYTYSVSGGFRGALTDRLDWEAFAQYGRRDQDYKISNTRIESRFFEAVDAVVDPASGNVVCRSATAQAAGCVPIDLFSGALTARGIDFAASYNTYLDSISSGLDGRVMLRATVTYLDKLEELVDVDDPSSLLISDGEFGDPTWRGKSSIAYENGGLNVFWNIRFVGPSDIDVQRTDEYYGGIRVDERFYHDVSVSYEFDNDLTLQAGVNNLFDEAPPVTPSTYTGAFDGSLFDNIGRFFFVGFSLGL